MSRPHEERTGYGRWKQDEESLEPDPEAGPDAGGPGRVQSGPPLPGGACELCGGPTMELHCKITCLRCGYQRDCSDP